MPRKPVFAFDLPIGSRLPTVQSTFSQTHTTPTTSTTPTGTPTPPTFATSQPGGNGNSGSNSGNNLANGNSVNTPTASSVSPTFGSSGSAKTSAPAPPSSASRAPSASLQHKIATASASNATFSSVNPFTPTTSASSAIQPTASASSISTLMHNRSKSRIIPFLAVAMPILLICTSLIVLYVRYARRRRRELRDMLLPRVASHDPTPLIMGHRTNGKGSFTKYEVVDAFSTSQDLPLQVHSSRGHGRSAKAARSPSASNSVNAGGVQQPETLPRTAGDRIGGSNDGESPTEQSSTAPNQHPAQREDGLVDSSSQQMPSALFGQVQALQERLRLVEDIAIRSVHNPQREESGSLERELRELIPPPEYTTSPNVQRS